MSEPSLKRELNLLDATMLGLGSILGTGVFVSIGIGAGIAGSWVVLAIFLAALVATCNALSSAQLAAAHPKSGGTYEYGYEFLSPSLGFIAGSMFLIAKSASAATAALGFAGYLSVMLNIDVSHAMIALGTVVFMTVIVLSGIKRSSNVNIVIVTITLIALFGYTIFAAFESLIQSSFDLENTTSQGMLDDQRTPGENITEKETLSPTDFIMTLFHATAIMFVAYTGYGRVATLAEEVKDPQKNIPKAIIATLLVSLIVYLCVGGFSILAVGSETLSIATEKSSTPLHELSKQLQIPVLGILISIGAMTAMLGVLLNLILGLSRIYLAMGRRKDLPSFLSRISEKSQTPLYAIIITGIVIAALTLINDVRTTWTLSAFTVLVYYSITNASALALTKDQRLFPRWISWFGLASCLSLAFFVEWMIWLIGLGVIGLLFIVHQVIQKVRTLNQ